MVTAIYVIYTLNCFFLIMVVLLQAGRGGGLTLSGGGGGQLGGGGGSKLLQNMTEGSAALFMSLSLVLAYISSSGVGADAGEFLPEAPPAGDMAAPVEGNFVPGAEPAPAEAAPIELTPVELPPVENAAPVDEGSN
jgi:preprotein translocase subunit SecG